MEHSSNMELIKKEHSSKMKHSYQNGIHQNGTLIKHGTHQKWNTHQKGTLVSKWNSSKWNTHQTWNSLNRNIHIIKKGTLILIMEWEHSYQKDCRQPETIKEPSIRSCDLSCLSTWEGALSSHTLHSTFPFWVCTLRSWFPTEWNSPHQQAMDYREEPWILIQWFVELFKHVFH